MYKYAALILLLVIGASMPSGRVYAQESPPGRIDVFVEQDPETGTATIYFLDALSGLSTVISMPQARRFTLVGNYVLYEKPQNGAVMRANANGTLEPHPFIQHTPDTPATRWVTSPDRRAIAWVQTGADGVSEAYVAWADGRDLRQLPIESPPAPLTLAPVALTNGMTTLFYDAAHPSDPPVGTPYAYYEHITEYNIVAEQFNELAQEPGCSCGAGFTPEGRTFARLEAPGGAGPFDLHIWDLSSNADILIAAPDLPYPFAGDLILNEAGTLAAYSVAAGVGAQADITAEQYALVLVDIVTQQQMLILDSGPIRYRPLAFIDRDGALLLTGVTDGATYKLGLTDGELLRVSDLVYLGTITSAR
jgi:hypothetical protein